VGEPSYYGGAADGSKEFGGIDIAREGAKSPKEKR
jgi:hypothetical protein